MRFLTEPRITVCQEGSVYMIRDRYNDGNKFESCEYAVLEGEDVVWKDCPEGVEYAAIEPFTTNGIIEGVRGDRPL